MAEKRKLRLCVTLLVLNLAFIWGNSLLPGEISGALSNLVNSLLPGGGNTPLGGTGLLRKLAHVTEFTCLGMCLRWLFDMLGRETWKKLTFSFGAGVLAACVDETIQIFVPDRGPAIKDVGIDTLGVILGIVIISLIKHSKKHLEEYNQ